MTHKSNKVKTDGVQRPDSSEQIYTGTKEVISDNENYNNENYNNENDGNNEHDGNHEDGNENQGDDMEQDN